MDCDAGFQYDSRNFSGGVSVTKFSAQFESSREVLREVDQMVERYAQRWGNLCREYNAGALDKDEYQRRSRELTEKMERLDELYLVLTNAPDAATYQQALKQAYATAAPEKAVELGVELRVVAMRPGEQAFTVLPQGASAPTDTRMRFELTLAADAHVYLYQVTAKGEVSPLFPDARIGVSNPVRAGATLSLPPAPSSFRLNAEDIGAEEVHVVVSRAAIPTLGAAIASLAGDPKAVTSAQLDCASRGLELDVGSCPESRGLVLEPAGDAGVTNAQAPSLSAINAAGDDGLHIVYRFEHTAS